MTRQNKILMVSVSTDIPERLDKLASFQGPIDPIDNRRA
jgi:hypothetical protein